MAKGVLVVAAARVLVVVAVASAALAAMAAAVLEEVAIAVEAPGREQLAQLTALVRFGSLFCNREPLVGCFQALASTRATWG